MPGARLGMERRLAFENTDCEAGEAEKIGEGGATGPYPTTAASKSIGIGLAFILQR
jgi:hypothetical protein